MRVFKLSKRTVVIGGVLALLLVVFAGIISWQYKSNLKYRGLDVSGVNVVSSESLIQKANLQEGVLLYKIDVDSVRLRLESEPWLEAVHVKRTALGKLRVNAAERRPVALVLINGRPNHYLDAHGYRMPLAEGFVADVPVLTGNVGAYTRDPARQRITDPSLREMLNTLSVLDERTKALVSEIEYSTGGSITVRTTPLNGQRSILVTLGSNDYERKLIRLTAFWDQVLLRQPDTSIRTIDLRYNNQILTT